MNAFHCIGGACEDNCCIGWRVDVDHLTYRKYQKVQDPILLPLIEKNVTRNRSATHTENNYAKIRLSSDGSCPFLSGEKLCQIQKIKGEAHLSDVCSTFPRNTNFIDGRMERCATLSCPETARLVLSDPESMTLVESDEPYLVRSIIKNTINTQEPVQHYKSRKYFQTLRLFTLNLMRNRSYALQDRLIILGLFFQKVQQRVDQGEPDTIPGLISSYEQFIADGSFRESLQGIPVQFTIQMKLLKEIADQRYAKGINSTRYLECFTEFLHGLAYTNESTTEEIGNRYQEAYQMFYEPFMMENPHTLENYLINHIIKTLFPSTQDKDIFNSYMMLVIHYALIKMMLIGMSGFRKNLSMEACIKLVQSFAKTVEHSPDYYENIAKLMRENGYNTMPYMSILIKN